MCSVPCSSLQITQSMSDPNGRGECLIARRCRATAQEDTEMLRSKYRERASAWIVDYSAARARAIEWFGDRCLLAKPIRRQSDTGRAPRISPSAIAQARERP